MWIPEGEYKHLSNWHEVDRPKKRTKAVVRVELDCRDELKQRRRR